MIYGPREIQEKDGRKVTLRNANVSDAAALLHYLKTTATETRFLMREPEEIKITMQQQEAFIKSKEDAEGELMLIAEVDGEHVGNCSISSYGSYQRYSHRCSVAIALYQEYCGLGIGRKMMEIVLGIAKECGYEQAELEVITTNEKALRLYESLGFRIYGTQSHSMKYKDGTYADAYLMMKVL